jgi:hypothetical protein
MSHLSSQPPEITAESSSLSSRSVGSAWAREKRFAKVLGRRMASGRAKCRCRASRPMSTIGLPITPHG